MSKSYKKLLTLSSFLLFISVSIIPSTGNIVSLDDITPPVTIHSLNPLEPDGENGYYVNDVEVTLNATDNESGVDRIEYRIQGGSWQTISGDNVTFVFDDDCNDGLVEYRARDNAGNEEKIKSFTIDMDQTVPNIDYVQGLIFWKEGTYYVRFTCYAEDETSGMDRVDMYVGDSFYERIEDSGPIFNFTFIWIKDFISYPLYFYHYDNAGNCIFDYGPGEYNVTEVSLF